MSADASLVEALRSALPAEDLQERLLAMLQLVDECLVDADVPYWVTGGSLLGAMRHKGFIPHDDDVDLELNASDWPRAQEALGAVGRSYRGMGEWLNSGVQEGRIFFWGEDRRFTTSIDIFLRSDAPLQALDEFPSEEEVFPLRRVPFHNITVSAPSSASSFLARCYGSSWSEEAVVWSHTTTSRQLLRAPLSSYLSAAADAGYRAPLAAAAAKDSLAKVGLHCPGELREELWSNFGWGSPWPLEFVSCEQEGMVLDLLGLISQRFLVESSSLEQLGGPKALAGLSGASVEVEDVDGSGTVLRATGDADELACLEEALQKCCQQVAKLP